MSLLFPSPIIFQRSSWMVRGIEATCAITVLGVFLSCSTPSTSDVQPTSPPVVQKPPATPFPSQQASGPGEETRSSQIFNSGQLSSTIPAEGFAYQDANTLSHETEPSTIPLVDRVSQWLFDQKYKCLETYQVKWQGRKARIQYQSQGEKRAVLECRKNCRNLYYTFAAQALTPVTIDHLGTSHPLPIFHLRGPLWGGYTVYWGFTQYNSAGKEPQVAIHVWSKGFGDYGTGCHFKS